MLSPLAFGIVLGHLNAILDLAALYVFQLLRLDDVLEAALITITFQFLQQVNLVLPKLFNPRVQRRHRVEHLIMPRLVL